MSTTDAAPEVFTPEKQLAAVVKESQLSPVLADLLLTTFVPLFIQARTLIEQSKAIVVTDATQVTEINQAREARLNLRDVRLEADAKRKGLKEESLRTSKAIQNVYNAVEATIAPEEARLQEQEDFAVRAESARKQKLVQDRGLELAKYGADPSQFALGNMTSDQWDSTITGARLAHDERLRVARAAAEEATRIREENARLKAEAEQLKAEVEQRERVAKAEREAAQERARAEREEIEAAAAAERAEAERVLRLEREAREKAERDAKAARDKQEADARSARESEARRLAVEEAASKAAAAAPDRIKLVAVAEMVRAITLPVMATPEGRAAAASIESMLKGLVADIERLARKLGGGQ